MASNMLSRLLPSISDEGRSNRRRFSNTSDIEHNAAAMAIDEENLDERFQPQDLEALLAEAVADDTDTTNVSEQQPRRSSGKAGGGSKNKRKSAAQVDMEDDDDVPESLLLQGNRETLATQRNPVRPSSNIREDISSPVPGPHTPRTEAQWRRTRAQQALYDPGEGPSDQNGSVIVPRAALLSADPKERARWKWANVQNLDNFLTDVYNYYEGHGFWSIILRRMLALLTVAFVIFFSTFLMFCIDYSKLPGGKKFSDVKVPKCSKTIPTSWNAVMWLVLVCLIYMAFDFIRDLQRLVDMHNFYHYLLDISEDEIQTASWQFVVGKLMALREDNINTAERLTEAQKKFLNGQSKKRMDAHDIANRLMRKDNYWIAMIDKGVLDVTMQIPFLGKREFFSKTVEWNIGLAVFEFVFDHENQIRPEFITTKNRKPLIVALKRRFWVLGIINFMTAPAIIAYFVVERFFSLFMEYKNMPGSVSLRRFTPLAEWKIREYNELPCVFHKRKAMIYDIADRYMEQFPRDKTAQLAKFVSFIAGALGGVLGLCTVLDSELFLGFEIDGRTVIFWLGALATIYKVARDMVPDDRVDQDPAMWLEYVNSQTHYCPKSWEGRLNTYEVQQEFAALYKLEAVQVFEELLSFFFMPFLFIYSMQNGPQAENIVDFFHNYTIHVDGLGHVCSIAVFDPRRNIGGPVGPSNRGAGGGGTDSGALYTGNNDKLNQSMLFFHDTYAGVPRRGLHGKQHRPFTMPPTFPGMGSMHVHMGTRQSVYGTPNIGPARAGTLGGPVLPEPSHSVLLDPHHQPRSSPRQTAQRRPRGAAGSRHQIDTDEHEKTKPERTFSEIREEDSEMGDSWYTGREATGTSNGASNGDGGVEAEGGAFNAAIAFANQFKNMQGTTRRTGI